MFGRGNWAIAGLATESLEAFTTSLEDRPLMATSSQMAASAITRLFNTDMVGINPYRGPRLDEEHPVDLAHLQKLAEYATSPDESRANQTLPDEILQSEGYGVSVEQFRLHPTMPWFGLWAVLNEWKDVSDLSSIKEQRSYTLLERPYKFLQGPDKNTVDEGTLGMTAAVRKQVPVLLDFNDGRVYMETNNKKLIELIMDRLTRLGIGIIPVAWTFDRPNWHAQILNKLYENTQFQSEFKDRADEATRFTAKEIEKLEDRELESIVANYFSMTQLPSDLWIGISGPAQVRLHDTSPPIGVRAPTTATTLLQMTHEAKIMSGAITFQERLTIVSKTGDERSFRKDLLSLDLNDKINLTEVGAAMLRGFDVPSFRKDIQREIRKTGEVPSIQQFWGGWLHQMSNAVRTVEGTFREVLEIDGAEQAGLVAMRVSSGEEVGEAANA